MCEVGSCSQNSIGDHFNYSVEVEVVKKCGNRDRKKIRSKVYSKNKENLKLSGSINGVGDMGSKVGK